MDTVTSAPDTANDVRRLLMVLGRLGTAIGVAISEAVGAELSANGPVITLFALDEQGSLRPGQLQELTGLSSGGVSKLLDRLQDSGLITREYGVLEGDRRGSVVKLTAKGRRTSRKMVAAIERSQHDMRVMVKEMQEVLGVE
jgi:DNA-binding HxlR family transcriptional regulator